MADADPRRTWDFFVSYTQADRTWAEWIAWVLEEGGHRVLLQAWDSVPGSNWVRSMQAGTCNADRTIAILSGPYLKSVYGNAEWQAAWASDPEGNDRRLLTVRVSACERPGLLGGVVGIDLFGLTEATARARLQALVASAVAGRAKPSVAPAFPGWSRAVPDEPRFPCALPRFWRVPAANPNFLGRGRELADMTRKLTAGPPVRVWTIRGMAGVGKTQLAIEYAHAHARGYDVVWQIAAEEPASILGGFTALAEQLGIEPARNPEVLRLGVHNCLRAVPGWLLIFDNSDQVEHIRPWLPSGPLPAGIPGHVIVTTRRGGFAALGHVVDLKVIKPLDALRLLRSRVPDLDQETGNRIAEELGMLPVAVEEAADFMERARLSGPEYLRLLRSGAADLSAPGHLRAGRQPVTTRWDISLKRILGECRAAAELLGVCAYLASEAIPLDLFTAHASLLPSALSSAAKDQAAWNHAVAVLADHSIAQRTRAELRLHPCAQAAVRASHDRLSRRPASNPLGAALRLLRAAAPRLTDDSPQEWPRWEALLPHVLAAVSYLDGMSGQPAGTMMADGAWLLDRAATYLQMQARLADAKPMLERALAMAEAMAEAARRPDHPELANHLNNLATVLRDLGQPGAAQPLMERALAIDKAAYGPRHPTVATDLNNLAASLRDLGQPEAARPLMEQALALTEHHYGPDHPTVAIRLSNLAMILRDLGEHEAARSLQERALAILEATYSPGHPAVARTLTNLATILHDLGQPEAARPLMERALTITKAVYGTRHPMVATASSKLAGILQDIARSGAGWPMHERTLIAR